MILEGFLTLILAGSIGNSILKCGEIPTVKEAYNSADIVFVGKVIEIAQLEDERPNPNNKPLPPMFPTNKVRLKVEKAYRGTDKVDEIEIETIPLMAEWGFAFKTDETYLIFANKKIRRIFDEKVEIFTVEGCGRTKLLSAAEKDLQIIEQID